MSFSSKQKAFCTHVCEHAQESTGATNTVTRTKATSAITRLRSWQHEKSLSTRTFAFAGLEACNEAADKRIPKIEKRPRPEVNKFAIDKASDAIEKNLKSERALDRGTAVVCVCVWMLILDQAGQKEYSVFRKERTRVG